MLALYTWQGALYAPDGRLHLTMLDTGGGDALLVQTPDGRSLLVDGGTRGSLLLDGLSNRLGPSRSLDWLVVANPLGANLEALPSVLEHYEIAQVLWAGPSRSSRAARGLQDALRLAGIPVTQAETGHSLDLGQGASLRLLSVGESGGVILVEWGNFRLLAPLGAEKGDQDCLADYPQPSVLILPSKSELAAELAPWIDDLQPRLALTPGLSLPEALETALEGTQTLRAGQSGWIHLSTDGKRLWVETEKK
jgi:competence protein ComEC